MTGLNHCPMNHQVVVDELGWTRAIGQNATHGSSNQKDILGTIVREPRIHRTLITQIKFRSGRGEDICESPTSQPTHQGTAHQPAMSSHINSSIFGHWLKHQLTSGEIVLVNPLRLGVPTA